MKSLRIAKQWGLEKMGRVEVVSESNTVRFLSEKNEDSKNFLKDSQKRLEKQCKANQESIEEGKASATAFTNFGQRMAQAYSQHDLASMMSQLAQFQSMVEELKESLNRSLHTNVGTPIEVLLKSDITEGTNGKAKYDKYRRMYDAAMTKYRNAENKLKPGKSLAEEDKEVAEAKKELEKATEEVTGVLEFVNKKTELLLFEKFSQAFTAHEEYFTRGSEFIREMKPHFSRYQQCADQARKDLEELRTRGRTYVPPTPRVATEKLLIGLPLADVMGRENGKLPRVIENAILFILRPEIIKLEGIFRISGNLTLLQELQRQVDSGQDIDYTKMDDPHCVAGFIKLWLRMLPESVFPLTTLSPYLALGKPENIPAEQQMSVLKSAVASLPENNKTVLQALLYLCFEIDKRQEENRMTASNLSTVVSPNLFFGETADPREMMEAMQPSSAALTFMIKNYSSFFSVLPYFIADAKGGTSDPSSADNKKIPRSESDENKELSKPTTPRGEARFSVHRTASKMAEAQGLATSPPAKAGTSGERSASNYFAGSNTFTSIVEDSEALPSTASHVGSTPDATKTTTDSTHQTGPTQPSEELSAAEKDGPAQVTGALVTVVTSFVDAIAPMIFVDVASEDQIQMVNKYMKKIAGTLKESFDVMGSHATTYPNTKSIMASAARHLRPAAKNLLAAARAVNEAPEDRGARNSLLAAARELVGAAHSLMVAALDVPTLPCAPVAVEAMIQQCAQFTSRILHITAGTSEEDIHATAFSALTTAEQLRFNMTMAAASFADASAAQQLIHAGKEIERHLSQLSSIAVPLLGGTLRPDLYNDPDLKEAARLVANEFRNAARTMRDAASLPPSASLPLAAEVQILRDSHANLVALSAQLETEAPSLSPEHAELLPHVNAILEHLTSFIASVEENQDERGWNAAQVTAAQSLASEAALLIFGTSEPGADESIPASRAVHYLRQLVPLVVAATGARRLGDIIAPAPLGSLPTPETLHPALTVAGLIAGLSSFLRQFFFSTLVPSK